MNAMVLMLASAAAGVGYGWRPTSDGQLEYIIQIEPALIDALLAGHKISSEIPPEVRGVRRFTVQVGDGPLPREGAAPAPAPTENTPPALPVPDARPPSGQGAAGLMLDAPGPVAAPDSEWPRREGTASAAPGAGNVLRSESNGDPAAAAPATSPALPPTAPVLPEAGTLRPPRTDPQPAPAEAPADRWGGLLPPGSVNPQRSTWGDALQQQVAPPATGPDAVPLSPATDPSPESGGLPGGARFSSPAAEAFGPDASTRWPLPRATLPNDAPPPLPAAGAAGADDGLPHPRSFLPEARAEPLRPQPAGFDQPWTDTAAAPAAAAEPEVAVGKPQIDAPPPTRPWWALSLTLVGLFASLGGNAYLGWIAWDAHARCRNAMAQLRDAEQERFGR